MKPGFIQTYSGKLFYPLDPDPELIVVDDIAHGLANQCRFAGQAVRRYYSVAEHSYHVSRICLEEDALWGLLHDAAEAYLGDLPRPLKHASTLGPSYRRAEAKLMRAICERFDLPAREPKSVDTADAAMLLAEQRDLVGEPACGWDEWLHGAPRVEPAAINVSSSLGPAESESVYLRRFYELGGR